MGCELLQVLSSAVAEMGDRLATIDMGLKLEGAAVPLFGRGNWVAGAYHRAKFHVVPSNRLATKHQCYRQTGQRSDSIERTV